LLSTPVCSKTGGLGDVVGSLPVALAQRGHRVFTIAPRYDQYSDAWDTSITVNVDGEDVRFFHTVKKGVHRVWVDHPAFLSKVWGLTGSKLYGHKSGADYVDNQKRFAMFCKAALESLRALPFMPGEDCLIVANDWHTSLIPVLLKDVYKPRGEFKDTKTALCVHNIAFQGRFWQDEFGQLGLPDSARPLFDFTDGYPKVFDEASPADESKANEATGTSFKKVNWLKAGILACDKLLTVSPNYATEIASGPTLGVELDAWVRAKGVEGIVNGMDVEEWSPALDKFLKFKYDRTTVEAGKAFAKSQLQREAELPVDPSVPVYGFIGRLEEQKGVDVLLAALKKLKGAKVQVVILGTGKKALETQVKALSAQYPGLAAGVVKFSNPMAHLITAGADFMLVPSRFEPCGLIQLHAMQYGTVPLVASTGGLVDTVKEGVTGFQMGAMNPDRLDEADAEAVAQTMLRAAETYGTPAYSAMRDRCIAQDLSWAQPAKKWEAVLTELKYGPGPTPEATADKNSVTTPTQKV
jgi:granule-bound starch synthase